jgi:ABC-type phosphate transport system permease subunit
VVASLTEDALRSVPDSLRQASYGLGATRWQTVSRVVVPAAVSGITAAAILGFGRALGETMIVLMATGNAALVTGNIFSSVRTMTATIAAELGATARGGDQYHALFLVGAVLFTITFFFNHRRDHCVAHAAKLNSDGGPQSAGGSAMRGAIMSSACRIAAYAVVGVLLICPHRPRGRRGVSWEF